MSGDNVKSALEVCTSSLGELRATLAFFDEPSTKKHDLTHRIAGDAVVKRFEVSFEYAWKLMKVAAVHEGSEAPGPRLAIQEAVKYGWIDDPEFWAYVLDARNGSVHDYFSITHEAYYDLVRDFVVKLDGMIGKIEKTVNREP